MVWVRDDGAERAGLLPPELMARVRQIQIRTHRLVNTALSGGYRSTFRGSGLEFQEVRAYQPGDDVRSIDWNVTARTGHPFIKHSVEERELTLNLLVDTSRSMDFGSQGRSKRETAAHFCALISFVAMRHGDRVGLGLFGEEPGLHLPARKDGSHVLRVVREVIAAEPSLGGSDLTTMLENQRRVLKRRSLVFLASDFLDSEPPATFDPSDPLTEDVPPWTETLAKLSRRHDVIAVRIVDPFERELPVAGLIGLREIETGRRLELDTRSRGVRDAWARDAARREAYVSAGLKRARVDRIELDTHSDIGERVLGFFRRRTHRHGGHPA